MKPPVFPRSLTPSTSFRVGLKMSKMQGKMHDISSAKMIVLKSGSVIVHGRKLEVL